MKSNKNFIYIILTILALNSGIIFIKTSELIFSVPLFIDFILFGIVLYTTIKIKEMLYKYLFFSAGITLLNYSVLYKYLLWEDALPYLHLIVPSALLIIISLFIKKEWLRTIKDSVLISVIIYFMNLFIMESGSVINRLNPYSFFDAKNIDIALINFMFLYILFKRKPELKFIHKSVLYGAISISTALIISSFYTAYEYFIAGIVESERALEVLSVNNYIIYGVSGGILILAVLADLLKNKRIKNS